MNQLVQELISPFLIEGKVQKGIALVPGKYKPPHKGHLYVIQQLSKDPKVKDIIILISPRTVNGITPELSKEIWEKYLQKYNLKAKILLSNEPSPVKASVNIIKNDPNNFYYVVTGYRTEEDLKDLERGNFTDKYENASTIVVEGEDIRATRIRNLLEKRDFLGFSLNLPDRLTKAEKQQIYDELIKVVPASLKETQSNNEIKFSEGEMVKVSKGVKLYSKKTGRKITLKQAKTYKIISNDGSKLNLEDAKGNRFWVMSYEIKNDFDKWSLIDSLINENQQMNEAVTHEMSMEDFNDVGEALRNPKKAKAIYDLLLQMFPEQKEVIDYNYKNDAFAEMKRVIHGIDKYKLVGPVPVQPKEMKLDPEVEAEREKKFQQFVKGEIDKYFRTDKTDPRKVDVSKFPPITMDEEGFVSDGNHRAFIAKKQNKPLKAYRYIAAKNDHPNVAKILKLVGRSLEEHISFNSDFISKRDVEFVDDLADRKLAPIDMDFTSNHFFDRLNDPRNFPDISIEELEEFVDKLSDEKEEFIEFLRKYKDIVVKDTETNINIPFMKKANKAIAKTIMRKKDFKTSNVVLPLEEDYKEKYGDDPEKGTGKKPKGSGRRLYTDEDPKDTVGIKFRTKEDIVDTLNKKSFLNKSHQRQSQVINLIHQRVRAAYNRAKDPDTKSRLKRGLDYIEKKKEASKEKTKRLKDQKKKTNESLNPSNKLDYYTTFITNLVPTPFNVDQVDGKIIVSGLENPYSGEIRQLPVEENVVPNHKGKAAPYGSGYEKLNTLSLEEGRYDQEVTILSRMIMNVFKENIGKNYKYKFKDAGELSDGPYNMEVYFYPKQFWEDFGGVPFIVNGEADKDNIGIRINYDLKQFPGAYNELVPELKDVVRHELEHIAQLRFNKDAKPDLDKDENDLPLFDYLTLDYEIPAFVQGIYKKAKTKKISFTQALEDFLDDRVDELTPDQENKIKKIYLNYAKNNLPKAQLQESIPLVWPHEKSLITLSKYLMRKLDIEKAPNIEYKEDKENAKDILGKTAYYNPNNNTITLYTTNRHPKDILRSFSHEMIHHKQNLEGRLNNITTTNIAEDDELTEIEREAYELGNILFRNWEDTIKND